MFYSDTFWSMFWIGLIFIPLLCVWMFSIASVFFRDMSGWLKAFWLLAIVFLPVIGTCLYLIVRPGKPSAYSWDYGGGYGFAPYGYGYGNPYGGYGPVVSEPDDTGPVRAVPSAPVDEMTMLTQLHEAGKLTDDEFATAKARVAASAAGAAGADKSAAA
jgi:Phospholipase_D-nuclease N-terminal